MRNGGSPGCHWNEWPFSSHKSHRNYRRWFCQWTWTHTSRSYSYADVSSSVVWLVPFAARITDGSFDFLLVSCSSEVPESTNEFTNSLSFTHRRWRKHSRDSVWTIYVYSQNINLELGVHVLVQCPNWRSCCVCHVHGSIRWIFHHMLDRLNSLIFGPCLDDSKCKSQFYLAEHTGSRDDGVSLGIESYHPTVLAAIASGVHHSSQCDLQ